MSRDPVGVPTRKTLRLRFVDYSTPGWYFITVCTHRHRHDFGKVSGEGVVLSEAGRIVERQIVLLSERLSGVTVDAFVVMPNHVQVLVQMQMQERARQASPLR